MLVLVVGARLSQLLVLVAVLRHAVVLALGDVLQVDVAVLVLQQLRQLLKKE